jgi:hypothetical protein
MYLPRMRALAMTFAIALVIFVASAAAAKEIPPDAELRVCGARQCRVLTPEQTRAFSALLWGDRPVIRARTPRAGSPVFQMRFEDGPAGVLLTHTAARVHGLNCGRFQRGRWYRLPPGLQGLTTGLRPKRLGAHVPRSC